MEDMTLYQKILESNLVNFIIMVSILVLIFKKAKLGAIFDKMADDIKTSVMTSADAAQAALKEYKEAKRSTKNIGAKKEEILNKAKETASDMQDNASHFLLNEIRLLDEKCDVQVQNNLKKTKEAAAGEIYEKVAALAEETIKERLLDGQTGMELQKRLIDKCIKEIDTLEEIKF